MRITILWSPLASYSLSFFKSLNIYYGCEIQLVYQPASHEAPYEPFDLSFCNESYEDSPGLRLALEKLCIKFEPDCLLINSWSYPHYMRIAKKLRGKGVYVVSVMDNQWHSTLKQWLGIISSRWFLKPSIDSFLVAGDRQAWFAKKLGYEDIMFGCYAADIDRFQCNLPLSKRHKNFLFIGRLRDIKGIDILIDAYQSYRKRVETPWGLLVAGTGKMTPTINGIPGLEYLGFIPSSRLPLTLETARCLILPSRFEPWGVVIHEAAAAGLPIIATYSCGATTYFVRDGVNGYIIPTKVDKLTKSMCKISCLSDKELADMGNASIKLASMWNPRMLARYFYSNIRQRCRLHNLNT